jgi:hypothetical protein
VIDSVKTTEAGGPRCSARSTSSVAPEALGQIGCGELIDQIPQLEQPVETMRHVRGDGGRYSPGEAVDLTHGPQRQYFAWQFPSVDARRGWRVDGAPRPDAAQRFTCCSS